MSYRDVTPYRLVDTYVRSRIVQNIERLGLGLSDKRIEVPLPVGLRGERRTTGWTTEKSGFDLWNRQEISLSPTA
jgi:hypothetical protein